MDLTTSTITLGSIIAVIGCLIGVLNYFANRKQVNKNDEARLVKIEAMLVNIEKNTSNLYAKVESHDKLLTRHEADIKVLQEKTKKKGF